MTSPRFAIVPRGHLGHPTHQSRPIEKWSGRKRIELVRCASRRYAQFVASGITRLHPSPSPSPSPELRCPCLLPLDATTFVFVPKCEIALPVRSREKCSEYSTSYDLLCTPHLTGGRGVQSPEASLPAQDLGVACAKLAKILREGLSFAPWQPMAARCSRAE
jgi:hypothetical protein